MSATTVQATCPAWCDQDGCDGTMHSRWLRGDGWQVQVIRYDDGTPAVHAAINNGADELPPEDADGLADAILAAVATLKA